MTPTALIVGTSVGGVRAAQALRAQGYEGRVVLLGEEEHAPYDKPPLSKDLLAGKTDDSSIRLLGESEAAASGIELRLGEKAERLDPAARQVHTSKGEALGYDHLVVATGCRARPSPWPLTEGVHLLRTYGDSLALRRDLLAAGEVGGHLAVIGAGFIGAEVASSARAMGLEVTVVDPLSLPMGRVVGDDAGRSLADLHARHGTRTRFGTGVESLERGGAKLAVRLTDGTVLDAAVAVVGIGAQPNDSWLESSGLRVDDGLVCDEYCRAVGAVDIYAVGDVARWYHRRHGAHLRVEHWTNAVEQAACVAHNIVHPDEPRPYQPVGYVWTDQYDWKIQIAGRPEAASASVTIGQPEGARRFAVVHSDDEDRLVGAMTVNWPRGLVECRRMLAADTEFPAALERLRGLYS